MSKYPSANRQFFSDVTDVAAFTKIFHTGFRASNLLIVNDSSNNIDFSFDGTAIDGTLLPDDTLELRDYIVVDTVYFKSAAGNDAFRAWFW